MIKKIAIFTVTALLVIQSLLSARPVTISGRAQGRVFEKVQVKIYADQFSHLKKSIAETITDENGNFTLKFDYSETNYAFLSVELLDGEFYLVPGSNYTFDVFPDTLRKGSVYDQLPLQFSIKADDGGLNANLARFNTMYNTFVTINFKEIYQSRSLTVVNNFRSKVHDAFAGVNNKYFDAYVRYSLAQLEWVSKKKSTKTIVNDYFAGNPVLFNNIQYTDFFKEIFKEYSVTAFYAKYYGRMTEAVRAGSFNDFNSILLNDEVLSNDARLRMLVLMQMVAGFYHNPEFSGKGILKILEHIKHGDEDTIIRRVAANYITKLTHLASGTPAPEFQLPVSGGKNYGPKDFKGQVVIFDFMKSSCKICLAHFDFLADMSSRLGSKLKIVVLAYGEHPEKITQLIKQRNLDWTVLYVGKRTDILESYDVKIFPTYIILNPDATIALAPASMADENLENEVLRVLKTQKK